MGLLSRCERATFFNIGLVKVLGLLDVSFLEHFDI